MSRAVKGCLRAVRQFPDALSRGGGRRWTLLFASPMRGCVPSVDIAGAVGQAPKAVIETAHALACRRRLLVLNEKRLVERTGLQNLPAQFTGVPTSATGLVAWVDGLREAMAG